MCQKQRQVDGEDKFFGLPGYCLQTHSGRFFKSRQLPLDAQLRKKQWAIGKRRGAAYRGLTALPAC
jgi:hypothetical protein